MKINKKCTVCSNDFEAKSNKALYCCNACRVKAHRSKQKTNFTQQKFESNNQPTFNEIKFQALLNNYEQRLNNQEQIIKKLNNDIQGIVDLIVKYNIQVIKNDNAYSLNILKLENKFDDLKSDFKNLSKKNENKKAV